MNLVPQTLCLEDRVRRIVSRVSCHAYGADEGNCATLLCRFGRYTGLMASQITQKGLAHAARCLTTAIPCFIVAGTLLRTWIDPMSVSGGSWVTFGIGIMVLEFVLIHSGAMMASWQASESNSLTKTIIVMTCFYGLFAGAMAAAFKSWDLLLIFTAVMLTRWARILFDPSHAREEAVRRSGISVLFYLIAVFVTLFMPIPELGITSSVLNDVYPDRGSGAWERDPEIALAAGILYFSLLGIAELWGGFHKERDVLNEEGEAVVRADAT